MPKLFKIAFASIFAALSLATAGAAEFFMELYWK